MQPAYVGGGGVDLEFEGTALHSESTDWGEGDDDNSPDDIAFLDEDSHDVLASWTFGDDATFDCEWDTLRCE